MFYVSNIYLAWVFLPGTRQQLLAHLCMSHLSERSSLRHHVLPCCIDICKLTSFRIVFGLILGQSNNIVHEGFYIHVHFQYMVEYHLRGHFQLISSLCMHLNKSFNQPLLRFELISNQRLNYQNCTACMLDSIFKAVYLSPLYNLP